MRQQEGGTPPIAAWVSAALAAEGIVLCRDLKELVGDEGGRTQVSTALEKAVDVLGSATEGTETGTLLATKFDLRKVVDLGRSMLSMAHRPRRMAHLLLARYI